MKSISTCLILVFSMLIFSGCELIGDIFKTGFYSGIFLVVLIIGIVIFIVARLSRKK
jgi:hypothetical protein